jgi:hypothetical protein
MRPLELAILRTILYADVFDFPLDIREIHHFLIHDEGVRLADVERCLVVSDGLRRLVVCGHTYYAMRDRAELIPRRLEIAANAEAMLRRAREYAGWLARLPFVRMVAITGALAAHNPSSDRDDFDYFIVVEPGRVWLTRAFAIALVRWGRLRGIELCPNYVLASDQLRQAKQDLFIAHEIAQMIPVYGREWYHAFREANSWSRVYQPNAAGPLHEQTAIKVGRWANGKQLGEWVFGGVAGQMLENWEYQRKRRRFAGEVSMGGRAEISIHAVKGHFADYGNPVLKAYTERLRAYGLDE